MRVLKEQEEAATQDAALKGKMWGEVRAPTLPHFTPLRAGVSSVLAQAVRRSRASGRGARLWEGGWGDGGVGGAERERKGGGRGACAAE
jgi:hypothetical protein